MNALVIRPMLPADLDLAVEWAAREGWNPGLADAPAFRAADPEGFLMGFVDNKPVTAISAVRYGKTFGFIGFYIAAPYARGRGNGWATWQAAMAQLEGRVIGLDGVLAQQANYRKSGFALAHRNVRYGGTPGVSVIEDSALAPISSEKFASVLEYDRAFFPAPRESFLRSWLLDGGRSSICFVEDGAIKGYGTIRACREGHKIGPLFADRPDIADALFRALAAQAPGEVFLDLPEPNASAGAMAERYGLKPVFETARMYRGPAPDLPLMRIYGITSFELG
ncbi:N-acetyltransferase GCN5 [Terrihabitans soli]|uniref:N-acetyltransferase GCN5 n=1 Tax=Terrihabitans soli TaxID=708113 RepID=A0A6S6QRJ0_9HYPH|nr:GNAT family N-acetyltransferase [Terrihabitans soli]BCJ92226.1 N-acetyltransferase GCN5 [Terrihabitans soli]